MRTIKLLTIFALFCCWNNLRAQTVKDYYLEIPNTVNIPAVVPGTGEIKLVFSNSALTNAFDNYKITNFELAFPDTITPKLAIVYFIQCEPDLIDEIATNYSGYFARHSEIMPSYDLYIPNDYYGSTMDQSYLDFIDAPDAWDISTGDSTILGTGESLFVAFPELSGKTAMVGGSGSGSVDHGTQVAIAMAGNTDNSTGIASIGFNSQIRGGNGLRKFILLADAGARAINYSRAMPESCSPTPVPAVVTDNFEYAQAVMDELWERGVVVIASAGNGTAPCPSNPNYYVYSASLNHVISVTSVGHRAPANSTDGNRMDILEYYDWVYFDPSDHYTTQ